MFDLQLEDGVAHLTLNRPEARNAIAPDGWRLLGAAVREAAERGAGVLLVRGTGSAFCAGADIGGFARMRGDAAARRDFRLGMREAFDALAALPFPTVAAVNGPCFGAGVALALACDLRVAQTGARFAITPAKFGISFPQSDVRRLVALVGPGQASRLLLTAQPIGAEEALRIGLVEILADDLDAEIARLVEAIRAGSGDSHSALKRAVALASAGTSEDSEQDASFDALIASDELHRRLAAPGRTG